MSTSSLPKFPTFRVGQDPRWAPSYDKQLYKSTIKLDFPAHSLSLTRQRRVPSPKPSAVVPTETRTSELTSLTSSHFTKKTPEPVIQGNAAPFSRKTNFKTDADERTKSFQTTHNEYFPVRTIEKFRTTRGNRMKSYIPQGDKEKVLLPLSNYKDSYKGNDTNKIGAAVPYYCSSSSSPILKGDPRTCGDQFETTSKNTFAAQLDAPRKLQPIINNHSSIRHGDQNKCTYSLTTNQEFYKGMPTVKPDACGPPYFDNVVLGDENGCRPLCNYSTTASECFPVNIIEKRQPVNINTMGKSSLPEGDSNPKRSLERITQTTNNYFFQKPNVTSPNIIVNGTQIRTKSNVDFGIDKANRYYNTTMKSNYPARFQSFERNGCVGSKSSVPLDYYGNDINNSTTFTDFTSHYGTKRLLPNAAVMDRITKSHVQSPSTATCEFITTHNESYPPKQLQKETYELGKLQRSSIPLGNLNVY